MGGGSSSGGRSGKAILRFVIQFGFILNFLEEIGGVVEKWESWRNNRFGL